jgi:phospholipid/cholesterol/gamma-HCH transport system substrate-binding protein
MTMTRKAVETTVGLFLLIGVAAMIWLALKVGNWSPTTTHDYEVTAHFDNIGGLTMKAPVTLAGVTIGRVASIGIDADDYSARITLQIDQAHDNLPTDTSAAILTSGLLGAQYVGLDPGAEETYLKDGDRIEITQSAVVLEHLIGQILIRTAEEEDQ